MMRMTNDTRCLSRGIASQREDTGSEKRGVLLKFKSHRSEEQPIDSVQVGNRDWWTNNPMTYDWASSNGRNGTPIG